MSRVIFMEDHIDCMDHLEVCLNNRRLLIWMWSSMKITLHNKMIDYCLPSRISFTRFHRCPKDESAWVLKSDTLPTDDKFLATLANGQLALTPYLVSGNEGIVVTNTYNLHNA